MPGADPEEFVVEGRYMSKLKINKLLTKLFGPEDDKWYKEVCPRCRKLYAILFGEQTLILDQ